MNTPNAPRLAILGGGAVVLEYYVPALRRLGWARAARVVDLSEGNLQAIRAACPEIAAERTGFADFLSRMDPGSWDAVVVALPPRLHAEACRTALLAGLPVLCEKPLATDPGDIRAIAEAERAAGKPLHVAMVRRFMPSFAALRGAFLSGLVGEAQEVEIEDGEPYTWMSESGESYRPENGGVLADMGVHYLDLAACLLGPLRPVSYSDDQRGGVEANCEYLLKTDSGCRVRLALSRTRHLRNTFRLKGARGTLWFAKDGFAECEWRSPDGMAGVLRRDRPFESGPLPEKDFDSCFAEQFYQFARSLNEGRRPQVTVGDAAASIELIHAAYRLRPPVPPSPADDRPGLPPGKVLVTGGTGFIGTHLIERLVRTGSRDITVALRRFRTAASVARFPSALAKIDLLNRRDVLEACRGARYVFHLAYGRDGDRRAEITVRGTRNVLEAARECGVECVVVASTIRVFGAPEGRPVDESFGYRSSGGEYGRSKALMEKLCLETAADGPTRVVVLNPSCVYGPGGETYTALPARLSAGGSFCLIEDGRGTANYTYVDNLVDAMLLAAVRPEASGRRFIISDGHCDWKTFLLPILPDGTRLPSYRARELARMTRQQVWARFRRSLVSNREFISAVGALPLVAPFRRFLRGFIPRAAAVPSPRSGEPERQASVPPVWLPELFGTSKTVFSAAAARRVLGWEPRVNLEEGQSKCRDWLRSIRL